MNNVLAWLQEQGNLGGRSFCDLSEAMVAEARCRAGEAGISREQLQLSASDLESLEGRYDTVICLDVFIHYLQAPAEEMVRHLAGMADKHLIVSFIPYTPLLALLKGIGQLFPGPFYFSRLLAFERACSRRAGT